MKNFASNQYWDTTNERQPLIEAGPKNPLRIFLESKLRPVKDLSVLEIGCFPGTFLATIGRLGYTLNGIDISPRTETDLAPWLKEIGNKCNKIEKADIFTYGNNGEQFDLVCSFGFIEHFDKFDEIINRHVELTKKGGKIIITTPNFKGNIQNIFHETFDKTNLLRHNVQSMDPVKWKSILESLGCKVTYFGWFGHFDLWRENEPINIFKAILGKIIFVPMRILRKLPIKNSRYYSPFCGIVAEKI